jgi:hypothetical protein
MKKKKQQANKKGKKGWFVVGGSMLDKRGAGVEGEVGGRGDGKVVSHVKFCPRNILNTSTI